MQIPEDKNINNLIYMLMFDINPVEYASNGGLNNLTPFVRVTTSFHMTWR